MKNSFLILLFLTSISFARTLKEDPLCAIRERTVDLKNSPFIFKKIKISGPHVILQGQQTSLTFNCAQGMDQFTGTRTVKDVDDETYQVKMENQNWLVVQENTVKPIWRTLAFIMFHSILTKNKVNVMNYKPIVITNKNENPVRTKVLLDQVQRSVEIIDPSNRDQSIRLSCDPNGGIEMNVQNQDKKSNFELIVPAPINDLLAHNSDGYKYTCYPKMSYDFKKESFNFEKEEKLYTNKMLAVDFQRKFVTSRLPPPFPIEPMIPLVMPSNMFEDGSKISSPRGSR